jgi:sulfoxide reductase heme-binding subunit YedZ
MNMAIEIPWTWLGIRASGVTAWGLLTAVVLWGLLLRTRLLGTGVKPPVLLNMHRWLGSLALAFLAIHLVLLVVDPVVAFTIPQLFIPGIAPWEPFAVSLGVIAMWLMLPVSVVGRIRQRLGKHGAMIFAKTHLIAYSAWPLATAHYVLAGTDAMTEWSIGLLITASALLIFGLIARGFVPAPARPQRVPAPAAASEATPQEVPSTPIGG